MIDRAAVRELTLYADNDGALYRRREPYLNNMRRKMAVRKYDRVKGVKLWEYFAEQAARKYVTEFGGDWAKTFPKSVRREAAKHFEAVARQEIQGG